MLIVVLKSGIVLSIVILRVMLIQRYYIVCNYIDNCYATCHFAKYSYAECRYAEHQYMAP